jgi:hypothetical protein
MMMMMMMMILAAIVVALAVADGTTTTTTTMIRHDKSYLRHGNYHPNDIGVNRYHHHHRYALELSQSQGQDPIVDTTTTTVVPSTTPSPSLSFVPSSIPSTIATTTTSDVPTSFPIGAVSPTSQLPPCNSSTTDSTPILLPQVQYSLYNQDRFTGEDIYANINPNEQMTYRPCFFSIRATVTSFTPPLSCVVDLPSSLRTNITILSVRMILYYYNETAPNMPTTLEVVENHMERRPPYFLYGNNNRTINTNIDLLMDGTYSIQSTIRLKIESENDDNDDNVTTAVMKTIPTAPVNFTLYPCVE